MSPREYWDSSINDVILSIDAYASRQTGDWEKLRSLEYLIYCALTEENKRVTLYQYMPLPEDPTPEEIRLASEISKKKKSEFWKQRLAYYAEKGQISNKVDGE